MNQPGWAPLPVPPAPPPAPYFGAPMPPPKPSGLYKALGIVQATLGAGGMLYALFGLAMSAWVMSSSAGSYMGRSVIALALARGAVNLLTGAMLIVTGIGVFKAKRWARVAGVIYACVSLVETFGGAAANWLIVGSKSGLTGSGMAGFEAIMIVTMVLGVLVASVLPVLTLVALLVRRGREELDQ